MEGRTSVTEGKGERMEQTNIITFNAIADISEMYVVTLKRHMCAQYPSFKRIDALLCTVYTYYVTG